MTCKGPRRFSPSPSAIAVSIGAMQGLTGLLHGARAVASASLERLETSATSMVGKVEVSKKSSARSKTSDIRYN